MLRAPASPWARHRRGCHLNRPLLEPTAHASCTVQVFIIEANPRASRTVPFVAKAIGRPLAAYASLLMSGVTLPEIGFTEEPVLNHVAVKASEAVVLLPV